MASRRGSHTTVIFDSNEPSGLPEGSVIFSLRTDSPTEVVQPPVWKRQSPIDIKTAEVQFDPELCKFPLTITYPRHLRNSSKLQNNGNTWKIDVANEKYCIRGGPLRDRYQLDQVHAHWGETDAEGSEHLLDGQQFCGEMHFVHWNQTKYEDVNQALNHDDGLSVIGIFYKIGQHNPELKKLTDMMEKVRYASCEEKIDNLELDLISLLPRDFSKYWTYSGSLTTQPYSECVTWIILQQPIEVSSEQIDAMRYLLTHKEGEEPSLNDGQCGRCKRNYRAVQARDTPSIFASFRPDIFDPQQSPIDICTTASIFNWTLTPGPLRFHYPSGVRDTCQLLNTGQTWKVLVDDERFWIKGGPLKNSYTLDQFHAHWGSTNDCGSEHTIDGQAFAGEIHFVHWNRQYGTIDQAVRHRDGLAVVAVFLEIGQPHPELTKLTDAVDDIRYAGNATELVNIDFGKLLPSESPEYWTYPGSLTTPPYTECVVWIVLKNPIKVSGDQMNSMRSLCCYEKCDGTSEDTDQGRLLQNYRPIQKLRSHFLRPS